MKIVGMMLARNEAWSIGMTARAALMWVDELVVFAHACTDTTEQILDQIAIEHPGRVGVIVDPDLVWREMDHRNRMLNFARLKSATHLAIIDADEILTGNLLLPIRDILKQLPAGKIFSPRWIQLRKSILNHHIAGTWARQNISLAFMDDPRYHWKAQGGEEYDFHHRQPMGSSCEPWMPPHRIAGGLMHLQMVSDRRLRAKQALYKMTEVLRWPGRETVEQINAKYGLAVNGDTGNDPLGPVQGEWWTPYEHLQSHLHVYAEPWQEMACRRLWEHYGAIKFAGLDLFGVIL